MTDDNPAKVTRDVIFLVLVASLGYFVDIYDLLIFSIVRKTSVPNFVQGALIPINLTFTILAKHYGMITSGYILMILFTLISFLLLSQLKETFEKDLDYIGVL